MPKSLRMKTAIDFNVDTEFKHPEIDKCTIKVAYDGENRNGSLIPKEAFEKAMQSIVGIPIVGEYFEEKENFGGHGGKIVIANNSVEYVVTTKAYGYVGEDANPRWEEHTEEDGTINEYLVVDGYLWSGRHPELETVKEFGANQSMEIMIEKGDFVNVQDEQNPSMFHEVFNIEEFYYSAFCLLGNEEANIEFWTEPCFESSDVTIYSKGDADFNAELDELKEEIKSFSTQEPKSTPEHVKTEVFELTYQDKYGLLSKAVKDSEGENWAWVQDFTDSYVEYEVESKPDDEWLYNRFRVSYSLVDEEITLSDDKVEIFNISVTQEEKDMIESTRMELDNRISDLEMQLESMQIEKSDIETELNAYKLDERKVAEDELFEAFDPIFKDSIEYADIKAKKDEFNIDELESQMRILHSKLLSPKFAKKKVRNLTTIKFNKDEKATKNNPYEGLTFNKEEK